MLKNLIYLIRHVDVTGRYNECLHTYEDSERTKIGTYDSMKNIQNMCKIHQNTPKWTKIHKNAIKYPNTLNIQK